MDFDREQRSRITVTFRTDVDPATSIPSLKIDDDWFTCDWLAAATVEDSLYIRSARTQDYFYGPDVDLDDVDGALALAEGFHPTKTRVAFSGADTPVHTSDTITVPSA